MTDAKSGKKTITLEHGVRLGYLERPGGEQPLVLLHGITDDASTYAPLLDRIDTRCRVFALDLRGHGESDKPDARYDTEAYAEDVRHFIREVAGTPAMVLGHSLGGLVAVQTGVTAPELVRALCLEDPPLYFVNDLNEIYETLFNGIVHMASTLQDGSRSQREWFEVMANAPDPYSGQPGIETMGAERIRQRLNSIAMMKPKALIDALDGSLRWDTDRILSELGTPVTLMVGNEQLGAVMSPGDCARAVALVRGCRLLEFDDVGHLIHDLRPDAWLAAVNDWIAESPATT